VRSTGSTFGKSDGRFVLTSLTIDQSFFESPESENCWQQTVDKFKFMLGHAGSKTLQQKILRFLMVRLHVKLKN